RWPFRARQYTHTTSKSTLRYDTSRSLVDCLDSRMPCVQLGSHVLECITLFKRDTLLLFIRQIKYADRSLKHLRDEPCFNLDTLDIAFCKSSVNSRLRNPNQVCPLFT